MKDSATSNLVAESFIKDQTWSQNPSTWSQKPSGVFVVLDAFWCVGVVFEFSSCLVVLLLVLVCLQIFVVFGCLWCIGVSSSFRCVWCFFGVLVWCLHFFFMLDAFLGVVGVVSSSFRRVECLLVCWCGVWIFILFGGVGVSSNFRRFGCLWCVGGVFKFSCLVYFWWCLQFFVFGAFLVCWCGVFKFCRVWCLFVGVSSSFRRAFWRCSCVFKFRRIGCLLVCQCWCVFKFSSCLVPFSVLVWCLGLQVFVVLDAFWCWCGVFKFSSCWVPFGVLVWCLQVFVVVLVGCKFSLCSCLLVCWCGVFKFSSCLVPFDAWRIPRPQTGWQNPSWSQHVGRRVFHEGKWFCSIELKMQFWLQPLWRFCDPRGSRRILHEGFYDQHVGCRIFHEGKWCC